MTTFLFCFTPIFTIKKKKNKKFGQISFVPIQVHSTESYEKLQYNIHPAKIYYFLKLTNIYIDYVHLFYICIF